MFRTVAAGLVRQSIALFGLKVHGQKIIIFSVCGVITTGLEGEHTSTGWKSFQLKTRQNQVRYPGILQG
jgi:hypothetical protein